MMYLERREENEEEEVPKKESKDREAESEIKPKRK